MRKIIGGKKYDTDTARFVGYTGYSYPGDLSFWLERLYRKKTGEFFLHGIGGPMSKYAHRTGLNEWTGGEEIRPLSLEEAQKWAEKYLEIEEYERLFSVCEE